MAKKPSIKNKFEDSTYKFLTGALAGTDTVLAYEPDRVKFIVERVYVPDFRIVFPSGHVRYIETKGFLRGDDITKMINVKRQHPDLDIRIFFQKDNKLNARSTTRYSDWAKRYGFPYCVGSIPDEWLREG